MTWFGYAEQMNGSLTGNMSHTAKITQLYRIEPSLGTVKSLSAGSCKHIREVLATDCTKLPNSGLYWL